MPRPSEQRRQREQRRGAVVIVLVLAALVAFAALRQRAARQNVPLDPDSFCPLEGGPRGWVAVLLDVSDTPNELQRVALRKEILDIERSIPAHHRVRVFVSRPSAAPGLPAPEFDRCKPPFDEGMSELTHNKALMRERFEEGYLRPFEQALAEGSARPPSEDSPILEWIQAAAVTAFPSVSDAAPRRLILVSDLMQRSADYTHYGSGPPRFEAFERTPFARKVRSDLTGFDVRLLYLRRDGLEAVQGRDHLEFWKRFFTRAGVGEGQLQIVPIEG